MLPIDKKVIGLFFILLISFSYFFQGGGYNQNANIGEIREFVEYGRFEISRWAGVTGDLSSYNGKIYSNKSPSMIFFAAPIYWVIYKSAFFSGIDTSSLGYQYFAAHVITILCSSLWGALLGVVIAHLILLLFPYISVNDASCAAIFFCLGTLVFPYATVAFSHVFETFWVIWVFYSVTLYLRNANQQNLLKLGIGFGFVVVSNPVNIVLVFTIFFILFKKKRSFINLLQLCAYITFPLLLMFTYNQINFDFFLKTNRHFMHPIWFTPGFFIGVFGAPEFSRLYLIFINSSRSLLPSQLFFYLGLFTFCYRRTREKLKLYDYIFPFSVIGLEILFLLSFNYWQGGICFGPRFFLPGVLCLSIFSAPWLVSNKKLFYIVGIYSVMIMFIVTSSTIGFSENDNNPIFNTALRKFISGNFLHPSFPSFPGVDEGIQYNLGSIVGLKKHLSFLPLFLVYSIVFPLILKEGNGKKSEP